MPSLVTTRTNGSGHHTDYSIILRHHIDPTKHQAIAVVGDEDVVFAIECGTNDEGAIDALNSFLDKRNRPRGYLGSAEKPGQPLVCSAWPNKLLVRLLELYRNYRSELSLRLATRCVDVLSCFLGVVVLPSFLCFDSPLIWWCLLPSSHPLVTASFSHIAPLLPIIQLKA